MKKSTVILIILMLIVSFCYSVQPGRFTIDLNGIWDFDQTDAAFPPEKFTRTIPVPGLVHLAEPKIDQYEKLFKRPERVIQQDAHDLLQLHYQPKYNWYRKIIHIPKELESQKAILSLKKSKYVTQVYVNKMDMGTSMACYTPVEFPVGDALKYGSDNEILIKVGDRAWLPDAAAGSTDKDTYRRY